MPVASAAGVAAVIGEHRAGQVCPFFGIKFKSLHIHLVVIDNQDSFIGNNIILGSPFSQFPVLVSLPSCNAAGQERITASPQILQGGSGQQCPVPVQLHLYAGFEGDVFQINRHSVLQDTVIMSDADALDAAGERSAGQGCPLCSIQIEFHSVLFVVIHKQDSFVGDNIVLGSPGGQCPVCVSSLGSDAAGQETIAAGSYSLQGSRGQQSFVAEQLHLYAICKCNVLQLNGYGILRNTGPVDAAFAICRCDSGQGADHDQSQHHCK